MLTDNRDTLHTNVSIKELFGTLFIPMSQLKSYSGHSSYQCLNYSVNRDTLHTVCDNGLYIQDTILSPNPREKTMYCKQCDRNLEYDEDIGLTYSVCCFCMGHKIIGGKQNDGIKF